MRTLRRTAPWTAPPRWVNTGMRRFRLAAPTWQPSQPSQPSWCCVNSWHWLNWSQRFPIPNLSTLNAFEQDQPTISMSLIQCDVGFASLKGLLSWVRARFSHLSYFLRDDICRFVMDSFAQWIGHGFFLNSPGGSSQNYRRCACPRFAMCTVRFDIKFDWLLL